MKKVVVIADLHIGFKKSDYDAIHRTLNLIEKQKDEIELLILNGDSVDLWRCPYKKIRKNPIYNNAFEHLQRVANIVRTVYVRGNHDALAHKIIGNDLNVEYKRIFIHENICYLHGDQFVVMQVESLFAFITNRCNFISKHISNLFERSNISNKFVKRVEKFKNDNFFSYVVVAHNHLPAIYNNEIVFCGDALHYPSYVEISEGCIKIKKI